jgi:hypothetical protein
VFLFSAVSSGPSKEGYIAGFEHDGSLVLLEITMPMTTLVL